MEEGNIFYKSISEATPMMSQYLAAKSECPDCLLLFRLGDFYECFFEDAKLASSILNIVLTKRGKSEGEDIPMCGIPFATIDNYVGKLIKSGQKVAICEQLESPLDAKKRGYKAIVKREVTRIISAGTLVEDNLLTSKENNYLMSVVPVCKRKKDQIDDVSFSLIDISTGAFFVNTVPAQKINSIFETYRPKEILMSEDFKDTFKDVPKIITTTITTLPHSKFNPQIEKERLEKYFKVKTLDSFGLNSDSELASCGSIIEYLIITQKNNLSTLPIPKKITMNDYLLIDASTNKSLDILSSVHEDRNHCLLGALDRTVTAFGARLLVERIAMPIVNVEHIKRRQQCVEFFIKNQKDTENLRELLQQCPDFERA
ncbi:MAG: DNA mismatch repair protein MutS, partial [Alphaproteobacteria bacterium]|nr:DNA mismatch repair protein MutS [Alphaproteobacteria bacterium]